VTPLGTTVNTPPQADFSRYSVQAITFGRDKLKGTTKTQGDFNLAHRFNIEIDGAAITGIRHIGGIEPLLEGRSVDDGDESTRRFHPGRPTYGSITIKRDWTPNSLLFGWYQTVIGGKVDRKSISIIFHNDEGAEARRINLFECYPIKYQGPGLDSKNSGHATEKVTIRYETYELK